MKIGSSANNLPRIGLSHQVESKQNNVEYYTPMIYPIMGLYTRYDKNEGTVEVGRNARSVNPCAQGPRSSTTPTFLRAYSGAIFSSKTALLYLTVPPILDLGILPSLDQFRIVFSSTCR